jgi:hypothetical protein
MTAASTLAIRAAAPADRPAVVRLLAAVYAGTEVACWLVPDPDARRPYSLGRTAVDVDQALQHGAIDVASAERSEIIGAALWLPHPCPAGRQPEALPPGPADETHPADMRAVLHRRHQLDELLQPRHPARAHHHLTPPRRPPQPAQARRR